VTTPQRSAAPDQNGGTNLIASRVLRINSVLAARVTVSNLARDKSRQTVLPSSAPMAPSNAATTSVCVRSGSTFQC